MMLDAFDAIALKPTEIDISEGLEALHKSFESALNLDKGWFGPTEIDKGNGLIEITDRGIDGRLRRDYLIDGLPYKQHVGLGNGTWATTLFDDMGTAYLKTVSQLTSKGLEITETALTPDTTIHKGNFTVVVDHWGRPILNTIEDLQLRPDISERQNPSQGLRNELYKVRDQLGHLIADWFGGPPTAENVVPQLDNVNQSRMRKVENLVAKYKQEGHRVDYSMKTNYVGTDGRPSSFEPTIIVDGVEVEIPADLKKIYNSDINTDSFTNGIKKTFNDLGERFGLAHEEGLGSAALAAAITCSVSSCENISAFINGEITADEMIVGIVGDTAAAGGIAYGTTFVTTAVSQAMQQSSSALISAVGGSSAPALVVSMGVESFNDIVSFANGEIDAGELAYDLGMNAAEVEGGFVGATMGAEIGMVAGPAGVVAGSVIGGVVGCAIASEAYASAVELGSEGIEMLGDQVTDLANNTIDAVAESMPDQVDDVRNAFNSYFSDNNLPFQV